MPLKDGRTSESADSNLWMLLCPLFCYVVLVRGSTLSPDGLQSIAATSLPENWLSTTVQLQPDLETEAQTLTEAPTEAQADALTEAQTEALTVAPTEAQTEALTEVQSQIITNNYTGQSIYQSSTDFILCLNFPSCVVSAHELKVLSTRV